MNTQVIGNYIREKRMLNGWTQEQFAERLDVSAKTVSTWENGSFISIKNANLEKLSEVLHVNIGEIYLGKDLLDLDAETKELLDREIENLNERIDNIQTVSIKVEDRGLLSLEIGVYAFGLSICAIALAYWAASSRMPVVSCLCVAFGLFGIGFMLFGKKAIIAMTKRVQNERRRENKQ